MKHFFIISLYLISNTVMAHTCHISLYDTINRPMLNFYSQNDENCESAATNCVQAVQRLGVNPQLYRCYTISITADPRPLIPIVKPAPKPMSMDESKRPVAVGETVIFDQSYYIVTAIPSAGFLNLIPDDGKRKEKNIIANVNRTQVAITRGCFANFCTRQAVIDQRTRMTTAIIGIEYGGTFITQIDDDTEMISNVPARDLSQE